MTSRRLITIVAVAFAAAIAIALGLGLGLGLHHNGSPSSPSPTSSATASPSPTSSVPPPANTTSPQSGWWKPVAGTTWQIEISYALSNTSLDVQVYDIDLFLNNASTVASLHRQGRRVICYFSAGSYESFRPDASSFHASDYGKPLDGWPNEWWLNTNSTNVRNIMVTRIARAKAMGCDGIDPDNVDGYDNDTGFDLSEDDAVDYLQFLAIEAHNRNLAIGLKNGGTIVRQIVPQMEWEVNEQCVQYDECALFQPFIAAGKPVFHIEYPTSAPSVTTATKVAICAGAGSQGFSTILKNLALDDWVETC